MFELCSSSLAPGGYYAADGLILVQWFNSRIVPSALQRLMFVVICSTCSYCEELNSASHRKHQLLLRGSPNSLLFSKIHVFLEGGVQLLKQRTIHPLKKQHPDAPQRWSELAFQPPVSNFSYKQRRVHTIRNHRKIVYLLYSLNRLSQHILWECQLQ